MNLLAHRARELLRDFLHSSRGNVAMMFAVALVPIVVAAGVGVDYTRAVLTHTQVSDALDAAALAVGSTPGMSQDAVATAANEYFDANYNGDKTNGIPKVDVSNYNPIAGTVTLHVDYSVDTVLMNVVGISTVQVGASSTVVWGQSKLWVALVLDNSTSMNEGSSGNTKMTALQGAAQNLLTKLQSAASNDGDVQVGIVPFTRIVNVDKANKDESWVYWGYWEASPPNATLGSTPDTYGPGVNCPFSDSVQGYHCQPNSTNNSGTAKQIPNSGMICPSMDNGKVNTDRYNVYYNGCWDSTAETKTVTTTKTQPQKVQQSCSQRGTNAESCSTQGGYPQNNGSSTSTTATVYTDGFSGGGTTTNTVTNNINSQADGSKSCSGTGNNKVCTWTRTFKQDQVTTTIVKSAAYTHVWHVNEHSSWTGCVMDRPQDYDISNTAPSGSQGFPAANLELCYNSSGFKAKISPLGHSWSDLSTQITNMTPNGYTNQAIGMAHGWQMLTPGDPWGTPAVPANTGRYIILFSDGLNTQDRWYVSSNTNVGDSRIDARLVKADASKPNGVCDNAKADGIIIYSVYIHLGNDPPDSASMRSCASGDSKYFNLSSADQIDTAFQDIAQQITNVRVSR